MSQNNPQFEQMIAEAEAMDALPIGERNALFINEFDQADNGTIKGASAAGSNMIRRRIRENGFTRRIIPPQTVGNEDLDRLLTSPKPAIIEDMEPKSRGAVSLPFGTAAEATSYFEDRFQCVFSTVSTPEFYKDINELRTTRMDLRQVVTENSLKDVETQEDVTFINGCDEIVGTVGGVGASGVQQNFEIEGGITRETYPQILSYLEDAKLNNGVILMNRKTAKEFLKWGRDEIGGDLAEKLMQKGMPALQESEFFGVKHIFTIKNEVVPNGVVWIFGEPGYLGRFYELQKLVLYVEKKKDILRTSARELISLTIANVSAIAKVTFTGVT